MKKLLIVEDDSSILIGLKAALAQEEYDIADAEDGAVGLDLALKNSYDIIILDIMLPGKNGYDICRELRQAGNLTPVVMLTSKKEEIEKVIGLEIGADDYITKPFSIAELKARLRALLRRSSSFAEKRNDVEFSFGNIVLNLRKHDAFRNDSALSLTAKEFDILKYFIDHEGEVVTRDMLLDEIWGYNNYPTTRTVDNYILSLRKKIEENPSEPKHLVTVHTLGYKFLR